MASIITLADCKTILQISDTSKDTLITALIPMVQDKVFKYCGNDAFDNPNIYVYDYTYTFAETANTITDSDNGFILGNFSAGLTFRILGSLLNDGIYSVLSVTAGVLTTNEALVTEAAGSTVLIQAIKFPTGIEINVADYIAFIMIKQRGITQESLGDYHVSYKNEQDVLKQFDRYRKVRFK